MVFTKEYPGIGRIMVTLKYARVGKFDPEHWSGVTGRFA
jgi:hypothetical protein